MGQRRVLVIGSQCATLPHLDFLPQAAEELYAVMTDPDRGACVSALEGEGLLINPSVQDAKVAIKVAYRRAAKGEATLFIAYVGHGEQVDEDFYLMPSDATIPPDSDTAIHLTNLIKETHTGAPGEIDGLAMLVDACYSGKAGFGAAQAWVRGLGGTLRFEVLTAAADRPAANGCFSRTLTKLLRDGVSALPSEQLHCFALRPLIKAGCPNQVPQNPSYNPDETLWLAKNSGRSLEPWAQTPLADEIQRLTLAYQPTPALDEVMACARANNSVAVVGAAGSGKSALSAALAWPKATGGIIPVRFVNAVAFLNEATTPQELARTLTLQLAQSVPGFREAQQSFLREMAYAEQQKLGTLEREVVGPLTRLAPAEVRLVVDALDRLATGARGSVMQALNALGNLAFVRLMVTARPDTELPSGSASYMLGEAPEENVHQYLARREVLQARCGEVVQAAQGSWLVVRVLADLICAQPETTIGTGQLVLADAYEEMLSRCGATDDKYIGIVLDVLAAAGAGPLLPLQLLCAASDRLGGPATPAAIRDHLVRLRGLTVRSAAGTEGEHAGLFHQTLVEHIAARAPEENRPAHQAILASIAALAPTSRGPMDLTHVGQRYAFEREAEHWWALGEIDKALANVDARISLVPRDNLRRWRLWGPRVEALFGSEHRNTLHVRRNVAAWTGQSGKVREAISLCQALLLDQIRVLGAEHRDTLTTRSSITTWTGLCGEFQEALQLSQALLLDEARVLGSEHRNTLMTRSNIAHWTSECGNTREALRLVLALLPDQVRVLGPEDPDTIRTRHHIATWTGESGDTREALRLFQALLSTRARMHILSPQHPDSLRARHHIAIWTGKCGEAREALQILLTLLPDQERVLGPDHPDTLRTRKSIDRLSRC